MTKTKERKKPVVGQMVYVVFGRKRGGEQAYRCVTRVGRKFGYLKISDHGEEEPFCLDEWKFHDPNGNANMNGYGFQIYESKEDFERQQLESAERQRLNDRIHNRSAYFNRMIVLPHDAVMKIHAILDEVEASEKE